MYQPSGGLIQTPVWLGPLLDDRGHSDEQSGSDTKQEEVPLIYDAELGTVSLAFAGDAMINRRMSPFKEEAFLKLVDILRSADASIANLEQLFHNFEMSWGIKDTPSFQAASPDMLDELRWMGFQLVTTATNHAYDYNEAGFLTTLRHCKERGLLQAGGGMNLGDARAPVFLDTAQGRVALMSAASTFSNESRAGAGRPDFPGKPGINALRHSTVYYVPQPVFDAARELKRGLHIDEQDEATQRFQPHWARSPDNDVEVRLFGRTLRISDGGYRVETSCNSDDLQGIADWIRGAKKAADWLVYGIHCHESAMEGEFHGGSRVSPPDFLIEFAHSAIDEGCHVVVGHGAHFLRGIEIYDGRPIFYSLGNFIFQNETIQRIPPPGYAMQHLGHEHTPGDWGAARSGGDTFGYPVDPVFYRSVVPVVDFADGQLREIRLYPIDLGFGTPMSQRGRPVLAEGRVAHEILEWLREVSRPFGTEITIEGDIGVIR